jgi:hypothetical protein
MESFNEILAKGLTFLVLKTVHKKSVARDYSPELLASMLKKSVQATRSSDKVFITTIYLLPCYKL